MAAYVEDRPSESPSISERYNNVANTICDKESTKRDRPIRILDFQIVHGAIPNAHLPR